MEKEKINKIVELSKKKEALEDLLKSINNDKVRLLVSDPNYSSPNYAITAQPYLKELHKRFVAMVMLDINDIETELETL